MSYFSDEKKEDIKALYEALEKDVPKFKASFAQLQHAMEAFVELIMNHKILRAAVVNIPFTDQNTADRPTEPVSLTPVLKEVTDIEDVRLLARKAVKDWYNYQPIENAKADRLTGFIQFDIDPTDLDKIITSVNAAKDKVKETVTSITNTDKHVEAHLRFYFLHKLCDQGGLMPIAMYRHAPFCLLPAIRITCRWDKDRFGNKHPKADVFIQGRPRAKKMHNSLPLLLANNSPLDAVYKKGSRKGNDKSFCNKII